MALRTLDCCVDPREWELGGGVIEGGRLPTLCRMTGVAKRRESTRLVVGICGAVVVLHVARSTVCRQVRVVIVHMALGTLDASVHSRERESSHRVIESCSLPARGGMANGAVLWESRLYMVRIGGPGIVFGMTRIARG